MQGCIINRKLKQITTRPSHFRMVELSDFMAYLDSVMTGLDCEVFIRYKRKEYVKKGHSNMLYSLMRDKSLFSNTCTPRKLCNVFVDAPPELLDANIEDLLCVKNWPK